MACPEARSGAAIAYDSTRNVTVLFGGCPSFTNCNNGPWLNDTWEWNGTTWTNVTPAGVSPSPRASSAMAFDEAHGVSVLFGGGIDVNETDYNDTWEWDGTAWTLALAADAGDGDAESAPPPRNGPGLVWDASKNAIVLFGGNIAGSAQLSDTWEWDGTTWTNVTSGTSPPGRAYFPMIYDVQSSSIVLWGGCSDNGCGANLADTWTWNGTWSAATGAGPSEAECTNCMTYHAATNEGILYGVPPTGSTWAWANGAWANITPDASSPAPPGAGAMAYDSARKRTVFFGGVAATATAETWEWDGTSWSNVTPVCAAVDAGFGTGSSSGGSGSSSGAGSSSSSGGGSSSSSGSGSSGAGSSSSGSSDASSDANDAAATVDGSEPDAASALSPEGGPTAAH
jgi:hypothetical protein